jgi:hypothetical protein
LPWLFSSIGQASFRCAVRLDLRVSEEAVSVHVIVMIEDERSLLIRWQQRQRELNDVRAGSSRLTVRALARYSVEADGARSGAAS